MTWQEYQEAVAIFYEQLEGIGNIQRNVYLPDIVTGQKRQVDVLITFSERGHNLSILIDAKFYSHKLDIKEIEAVMELSKAVGVNKSVIVAPNDFTEPAKIKANFMQCDLRIFTIDEATDLIIPEKWFLCQTCYHDCIILDQPGAVQFKDSSYLWWLGGQCRECKTSCIVCQGCGKKMILPVDTDSVCDCGYTWFNNIEGTCLDIQKDFYS